MLSHSSNRFAQASATSLSPTRAYLWCMTLLILHGTKHLAQLLTQAPYDCFLARAAAAASLCSSPVDTKAMTCPGEWRKEVWRTLTSCDGCRADARHNMQLLMMNRHPVVRWTTLCCLFGRQGNGVCCCISDHHSDFTACAATIIMTLLSFQDRAPLPFSLRWSCRSSARMASYRCWR